MSTPLKYMREEFKKLQWALYLVIIAFVVLIFATWGSGGKLGSELAGDEDLIAELIGSLRLLPLNFLIEDRRHLN